MRSVLFELRIYRVRYDTFLFYCLKKYFGYEHKDIFVCLTSLKYSSIDTNKRRLQNLLFQLFLFMVFIDFCYLSTISQLTSNRRELKGIQNRIINRSKSSESRIALLRTEKMTRSCHETHGIIRLRHIDFKYDNMLEIWERKR